MCRSCADEICGEPVCPMCVQLFERSNLHEGRLAHDSARSAMSREYLRELELARYEHASARAAERALGRPPASERLWLIDADQLVHAAFHGVPLDDPTPTPQLGIYVNAVVGFARSIRRITRAHNAELVIAVFDGENGGGWRKKLCPAYKSDRDGDADALVHQWPLVYQICNAMDLPMAKLEGVEADDLIASYTEAAVRAGMSVEICSNDSDMLALVRGDGRRGSVRVFGTRNKAPFIDAAGVLEKLGVPPELVEDWRALVGGKDGLSGVHGIGGKIGAELLMMHGSLEKLIDKAPILPKGKRNDAIIRSRHDLQLWRQIVALDREQELPFELDELAPWRPDTRGLDTFARDVLGYPGGWRDIRVSAR